MGLFESATNILYIVPRLPLHTDVEEVVLNISVISHTTPGISSSGNEAISYVEIRGKLYREIPETEWNPEIALDPAGDIKLEKGRELAILDTLKLGNIGGLDLTIYILILIALATLIFFLRYRK